MEIKKHIVFSEVKAPELYVYLKANAIPFKEGSIICTLDLMESSPHWIFVSECVSRGKLNCQSETIFTNTELDNAQWLRVRSKWRNGYPQPEKGFGYESITYCGDKICSECGCGLQQVDAFRLKQQPKWGRRHFMVLNWVDDELFVSPTAQGVLRNSVSGIEFAQVRNKTGKETLDGMSQMKISHILPEGMVEECAPIRQRHVCPCCGTVKYVLTGIGKLAWRKEIFDGAPDIVKSGEMFGSGHFATRLIFIRQSVYQLIRQNQLDRDLVFEPIDLI